MAEQRRYQAIAQNSQLEMTKLHVQQKLKGLEHVLNSSDESEDDLSSPDAHGEHDFIANEKRNAARFYKKHAKL